jgi:hypothetical protein
MPRLMNQPIKILWAGFETDTLRLQRQGWQLAVEECHSDLTIRIAMKHPMLKLYAVTDKYERRGFGFDTYHQDGHMVLNIRYLGPEIKEYAMPGEHTFLNFRPINAEPLYEMCRSPEGRSIDDFNLFKPLSKEKEIVIPNENVTELLERIQKLQKPKQDEIRKRKSMEIRRFNKDVNEYELETELVAQISTLK